MLDLGGQQGDGLLVCEGIWLLPGQRYTILHLKCRDPVSNPCFINSRWPKKMFDRKKSKNVANGKKSVVADNRDYYVTQPAEDLAAKAKHKLASGVSHAGQTITFKDGVLSINKRRQPLDD